jgi:hypothetical protein
MVRFAFLSSRFRAAAPSGFALMFIGMPVQAADAEPWAFKFTSAVYAERDSPLATDQNLRGNLGEHTTWIGHYQRGGQFAQTRAGYEYTFKLPFGQVIPSLQAATHGFVGGAVTAQLGSDTAWAIVGVGRTNLKPYYNLSFDPNDSVVLGAGVRVRKSGALSLFTVADDRLGTGQKVTHLVWRDRFTKEQRITIDVVHKTGSPEAGLPGAPGKGLTVTYDHGNLFARIGREQNVNFTTSDQTRFAAGFRF